MPVRPSDLSRLGSPVGIGAFVVALSLAAFVAGGAPRAALAQSDDLPGVDDDAYESPTFGYTLDWDDREWEVVDATSDQDDGDTLVLTNEISTLYITGVEAYRGDGQECSIDMGELVADPTALDTYPSESGARDLDPEDYSLLVDCRELVEDEAVLVIVHVFPAAELGKELVEAQVVTDSIEIDDSRANRGGGDLAEAGVVGNTYESPAWGYTLEWDDDVWQVRDASARAEANVLNLINVESSLIISGIADLGDVDACMEQAVAFYSNDEGVEDWAVLEDEDGDPIERSTRRRAYAAYVYTVIDEGGDEIEFVNYIECLPLNDDAGLLISHLYPSDLYEEQSDLRDEVLDTLEIS